MSDSAAHGTPASSTFPSLPISSDEIGPQIDLLIALHLSLWPALTIAIQNGWGTSNPALGEDKRDWLAGAISDLFVNNQLRDLDDLEDVLTQVLSDEFEIVVEDGSLEEVARGIWKGRERVLNHDGGEVKGLMTIWESKRAKGKAGIVKAVMGAEVNQDTDDSEEEEWNGFADRAGGDDMEMDDAPALVESTKKKDEPVVDEDGFTMVTSKKKR